MSKIGYIYAIENDINDDIYIGSTMRSITERFSEHITSARRRPTCTFHKFMQFHGTEHFFVTEVKEVKCSSFLDLQTLEESYIRDYGTLNTINGTNKPQAHSRKDIIKKQIIIDTLLPLPSSDEIIRMAVEASYVNILNMDDFIDLFISEEENWDKKILEVTSSTGKLHLSASLLKCLGYEGDLRVQQQHVKRFLKSNNVELLELSTDDPRVEQYPSIEIEINEMGNKGAAARRKWFIVEPREFKKVIMKLNTKNGDRIREYYIRLEELIKSYTGYVLYFNDRESKIKLQQERDDRRKEKEEAECKIVTLQKMVAQSDQKLTHLISCAEETKDQLDDILDVVQDHNETLDDKLTDILKPVIDNMVKYPDEKSLKARFVVMDVGDNKYRIARGQTRHVSRAKAMFPDAKVILDLPLVGAQDRMTEVRKQIRKKIKDKQFGDAIFKASVISDLDKQFEKLLLRTILDVHEEFKSIPEYVIKQARQELLIVQ
jgi:MSV199 domain/GIY-YIG catalytic domain/Protein of unknown function (DUF3627)